jgi:hypothetical protein
VAVSGQPLRAPDKIRHVALLQTDGFAAVALKQCLFVSGIRPQASARGLEKHPAATKASKV